MNKDVYMKPLYFNIEGIDGAGKQFCCDVVSSFLQEKGRKHYVAREPGGTPLAEAIRSNVKAIWEEDVTPLTELLLMFAARNQLLQNVVIPKLNLMDVITDRSWMSTFAYQVRGSGVVSVEDFNTVYNLVLSKTPKFDISFILDIDPSISSKRVNRRNLPDRIELNHIDFFERARQGYLELAKHHETAVVIDASQSKSTVEAKIRSELNKLFEAVPIDQGVLTPRLLSNIGSRALRS
jgi:dTMP kinase